MAAESSGSTIAGMQIEFGADFAELDSASSDVGALFADIQAAAEEASTGISESLTGAAESFSGISQAAEEASAGISDSNEMALASYDELASGAAESLASIADGADSAASGVASFGESGAASSADLIEVLSEISQSITALRETFSDAADALWTSMNTVADSVKDVQYAVEAMSSDVTGTIEDLGTQFGSLGEQAQEAGSEIESAGEQANNGNSGFLNFFNQIGIGIFNVQNFINIAKQLTGALLDPAASAETVSSALTTMLGSSAAASAELQKLDTFASHTPFETLDIDQAAEQLIGFGANAKDVIPELTAIGDALGSVGRDTPTELMSVVDIFGKIQTEGKVTAATMNELAIHGINGWQALADATGKSIPQLKDMVAKGLLPANQAIADLTSGIEKNPLYAGGMARAAGTFTGLLSTLKSNFDQVLASFGSPIIKALEPELNNLGSTLSSPGFKNFAGAVGQGIVTVFQDIGGAAHYVENVFGSLNLTGLTQAWGNLQTAVAPLGGVFEHLGSTFSVIGTDADPIADIIQKIAGAGLGTITDLVQGLASALKDLSSNSGVSSFLSSLESGFKSVSGIVGGNLTADFQTFSGVAKDLGKWWQSTMAPALAQAMPSFESLGKIIATDVAPSFAKIWSVGQQVARDLLPPLTKAFETIAPIVVKVGGAVANELGKGLQFIMPYLVQAATAIGQFADQVITKATPVVEELWGVIQQGINAILPIWNAVWPSMQQVLEGVWKMISGTVQVAWAIVSGIVKVGLDLLSGNWKGAWKDIQDTFSGVWSGLSNIVSGAWDTVKGLVAGGINAVIGIINSFINGLDKMHVNVPGIGNVGFNIPDIPTVHFFSGGYVPPGGAAIAGDPGPYSELVFGGATGATVMSHAASSNLLADTGGSGRQDIHVHVYLDGREMTQQVGMNILSMASGQGPVRSAA